METEEMTIEEASMKPSQILAIILMIGMSFTLPACTGQSDEQSQNKPSDIAFQGLLEQANRGDAKAQATLGVIYYNGQAVPRNIVEAVKWLQKAAEQGNARAQVNFGYMYEKGQGVPKDYAEAVKWYKKSAEQGDSSAQCNLAMMYGNGHGVPQDYAEAVKWYKKSAGQGDAFAQKNLGQMYSKGQGVPQDYTEAYKWYTLAVSDKDSRDEAIRNRDIVAEGMTVIELMEAQKRASEWKPTR
jgi:hypothetical protein